MMKPFGPIAIPRAVAAAITLSLSFTIAYQIYSNSFFSEVLLLPLKQSIVTQVLTQEDEQSSSCTSRHHKRKYQSPSPHLASRLREYEQRHKVCEPLSESFNRNSNELVSRKNSVWLERSENVVPDCRYVVYTPMNGLGNRMLDIASAFLYVLLTNRVLLVDFGDDMTDLFCEPFLNSTWLLPGDFPFREQIYSPQFREVYSFGNLFRNKKQHLANVSSVLKLHLSNECDIHGWRFFEDESQELLRSVPWLILTSDQYFLPYLFLMPGFRTELDRLFPDKETVFHHLGRYLFNPSNEVWGLVTRFHKTYLTKADQRIGLHIRVVRPVNISTPFILNRILKCTQEEARILPRPQQQHKNGTNASKTTRTSSSKAVLVASLSEEFYSELKSIFWTRPMTNDVDDEEVAVGVYQTSHEGVQLSLDKSHNMKALADIYLLSMCDVLVTSPGSTFGYVAQSLGNLRPWVLEIYPDQANYATASCAQPVSKEPCYHFRPIFWEKKVPKTVVLPQGGGLVPSNIIPCEDVDFGVKLSNVVYISQN